MVIPAAETMSTPFCPHCGARNWSGGPLCGNCGARLPAGPAYDPSYVTPYAPLLPQPHDHTALIVVVVILVVVILVALPAALYLMVSGLMSGPSFQPSRNISIAMTRSPDDSHWNLTFTMVPTGLSNTSTYLAVVAANGSSSMPPTALGNLWISTYRSTVVYEPASSSGTLEAGDALLLSTTTYPAGSQVQISAQGGILYAGTLQ